MLLYYIVVITGAATLTKWILQIVEYVEKGGRRKETGR